MFMGTYYNSIDSKNRMIVPSKHRDRLGGRCVITKGIDSCLYIYSVSEWEKKVMKFSKLPESDIYVREAMRRFFADAVECEFDKQGRIVIPQELINYAEINKELITMGVMDKIEIWAKEIRDAQLNKENELSSQDLSEALAKYDF